MSTAIGELPAGEAERLAICSLEPIRTPGAVQPHGALLVVDEDHFRITHAGENTDRLLGVAASDLLGTALSDLVGATTESDFSDILDHYNPAENPVQVTLNGREFDAIVHRADAGVLIEFEPASTDAESVPAAAVYRAMHRLTRATTREQLWADAAVELRRLTGFDQVMIYHFHPDTHGEIVAEERAEEMEPYLGLHFPASDIPAQARELYLTKLSRAIVNSASAGAALLGAEAGGFDLTCAELRSVSPHHLEFMRNMGQASTLSLSLVHDGVLIGMVTCAHRTARSVPFELRQALEMLSNQVALQLSSMLEIGRLKLHEQRRAVRSRLVAQVTDDNELVEALLFGELSVLDLVPAEGAAICLNGVVRTVGTAPAPSSIAELAALITTGGGSLPVVTDTLELDYPELAEIVPEVAGLIMMPLGSRGDYIAWFRPEIARSVNWLGDLSPENRASTLSPRTSFSSWNRSVSGSSVAWHDLDVDAAELCRDLDGALLRRAESKLAALAVYDPLTGLPNRRLLMERLEQALTKFSHGQPSTLLFIDLDGFKTLNDSLGHEMGDRVLTHVAAHLTAATRADDTVARLGGDEFVVLCEDTAIDAAGAVATRIVEALREPVMLSGQSVVVTASIGLASAAAGHNALELLRAADAAMYRAKNLGRNRVSR
jgi:chemotaxis family two-component system sensor kinase Cph1